MGEYRDGKYFFTHADLVGGVCSDADIIAQQRAAQKKLDENNAGEFGSPIQQPKKRD